MDLHMIIMLAPLAIAIIFMIFYSFNSLSLYYYLMNHKCHKWEELTTVDKLGSGFLNPKKMFEYACNINDDDDAKIKKYKIRLLLSIKFAGIFFLVFVATLLVYASVWENIVGD